MSPEPTTTVPVLGEFVDRLVSGLLQDAGQFQRRNTDPWRYPAGAGALPAPWVREWLLWAASRSGFVRRGIPRQGHEALRRILCAVEALAGVYRLLHDDHSRRTLIDVLKFRVLGPRHVKFTVNSDRFWTCRSRIERVCRQERGTVQIGDWRLDRYRAPGAEKAVDLHCLPLNVLNTFFLEEYAYRRNHRAIAVDPGDVVLDAGSCWGDTALYFAERQARHVYAYECAPDNLGVLRRNLALNRELAERITVVPRALWATSGQRLVFASNGPGSFATTKPAAESFPATSLSIDDFVDMEGLARVDFIKMDIEGAEPHALRGAERTLRRFRPKLAISVYHADDDLVTIPTYLHRLGLGYEFFLDHFTIYQEETILFAQVAGDRGRARP